MQILKACLHESTHYHFQTQAWLMEAKSFKNEIFWSQIGFKETDVAFPPHQRFQ